jgi:NAD+ synthase
MKWPENPLQLDPELETRRITSFISETYQRLGSNTAVIGLSGGLDSSLTAALAVQALGSNTLRLIYMPERDSNPLHREHALTMAECLGCSLEVIKISAPLRALRVYRLLPLTYFPGFKLKARAVSYGKQHLYAGKPDEYLAGRLDGSGGDWVDQANAYISAKHRVRSVVLYREAERSRGMVIGAANRTEWLTGTFTHWGCDHSADLMPILHLYRSQLQPLAEYLHLPAEIIHKMADPDLLPGLGDKGSLLGSFEIADSILWGFEKGYSQEELSEIFDPKLVTYIKALQDSSAYFRETPYSLL